MRIQKIYDRNSQVKKIWAYNIDLMIVDGRLENLPLDKIKKATAYTAYTMRVTPEAFKAMKIKCWDKVKAIEDNSTVCGIFSNNGIGFMFTNIPFEWK